MVLCARERSTWILSGAESGGSTSPMMARGEPAGTADEATLRKQFGLPALPGDQKPKAITLSMKVAFIGGLQHSLAKGPGADGAGGAVV